MVAVNVTDTQYAVGVPYVATVSVGVVLPNAIAEFARSNESRPTLSAR
jgi:hypothetical protein